MSIITLKVIQSYESINREYPLPEINHFTQPHTVLNRTEQEFACSQQIHRSTVDAT